jgi:hypothetical protein
MLFSYEVKVIYKKNKYKFNEPEKLFPASSKMCVIVAHVSLSKVDN